MRIEYRVRIFDAHIRMNTIQARSKAVMVVVAVVVPATDRHTQATMFDLSDERIPTKFSHRYMTIQCLILLFPKIARAHTHAHASH